jgi:hypothetical protein
MRATLSLVQRIGKNYESRKLRFFLMEPFRTRTKPAAEPARGALWKNPFSGLES